MSHPVLATRAATQPLSQRLAEQVAQRLGSWTFILAQTAVIAAWVVWNALGGHPFDAYPFIFLNLTLSLQAAYTGPILLVAANRQNEQDRALATHDHELALQIQQLLAENTVKTDAIYVIVVRREPDGEVG